jgi:hypothetical protein
MRQLCQFIVRKKKAAVSSSSLLKDSKAKNKKNSNEDSIVVKSNESFVLDERREEQIPKTSSFSWAPEVKKDANRPTSSLADLVSSEAVATSTTTRHWLQAHEATLLECGFQMVGSVKATTKSMGNDFSNEDIIDELISTFQGPHRSRWEQRFGAPTPGKSMNG